MALEGLYRKPGYKGVTAPNPKHENSRNWEHPPKWWQKEGGSGVEIQGEVQEGLKEATSEPKSLTVAYVSSVMLFQTRSG